MANRAFFPMLASLVDRLTLIQGQFSVGSAGAVSAVQGNGVTSVTLGAAGQYIVKLDDRFNKVLDASIAVASGASAMGTPVAITALSPGTIYAISTVGSATQAQWETAGIPAGATPAVGLVFRCAATSAGASSAAAPIATTLAVAPVAEFLGDLSLGVQATGGGQFAFQLRDFAGAAANAASGSVIKFSLLLRNSAVKGKGE